MNTHQRRIDVERDAIGILRHMVVQNWRYLGGEWVFFSGGVHWTIQVFEELLGDPWPTERIANALQWLIGRRYLLQAGEEYRGTVEGCEAYSEAVRSNAFAVNIGAWKDEALTGMTASGQRSSLDNAALPSPGRPPQGNHDDAFFRALEHSRWVDRLAEEHNVDAATVRQWADEGLLKQCNQCGKVRRHHRDKGRNTGFKHACVECEKRRRKKNEK